MRFDDSGQAGGALFLLFIGVLVTTIAMGVMWIFISPMVGQIVSFVDSWILAGWVTDQGYDLMNWLGFVWAALPSICFLGYLLNAVVKSIQLKGTRGF